MKMSDPAPTTANGEEIMIGEKGVSCNESARIFSFPTEAKAAVEYYSEVGFCILRGALPSKSLRKAQAGCELLVNELARRLGAEDVACDSPFDERLVHLCASCPDAMPNLFRHELHRREFFPLLADPKLCEFIGRQLMSEDVTHMRIYPNYSCRPKTKSKLHSVTWHQDAGLRADGGPSNVDVNERLASFGLGRVVNLWTPLVKATRDNGAMIFVPGSHNDSILKHEVIGAYQGSTGSGEALSTVNSSSQNVPAGSYKTSIVPDLLTASVRKAGNRLVHVECIPGDVVLFSNLLIHRGGVNTTEKIRWSFDWRYQDAAQDTHRDEKGHIIWKKTARGDEDASESCGDSDLVVVRTADEWAERTLSGH